MSFLANLSKITKNATYFVTSQKGFGHRAKWSIWLQSAFHSANCAYNIKKFREKNLSKVLPYWPILTGPWPERKVIEKI